MLVAEVRAPNVFVADFVIDYTQDELVQLYLMFSPWYTQKIKVPKLNNFQERCNIMFVNLETFRYFDMSRKAGDQVKLC